MLFKQRKPCFAISGHSVRVPMCFDLEIKERFAQEVYEFAPWNMPHEIWRVVNFPFMEYCKGRMLETRVLEVGVDEAVELFRRDAQGTGDCHDWNYQIPT